MRNSKNPLFILLAVAMATCTEDIQKVNSGATPYKIINSEHNFSSNGILLYFAQKANGNFEFYDYNGSGIARTTIDADGKDQHEHGYLDTRLEFVDTTSKADPSYAVYSIEAFGTSSFLELGNIGTINRPRFLNLDSNLPDPGFDVEIRFGPGRTQYAQRIGRADPFTKKSEESIALSDRPLYDTLSGTIDYVPVPFEVYDVTNNRQLDVSFHDEAGDGKFNLIPSDSAFVPNIPTLVRYDKSEEYIYVSDLPYSPDGPFSGAGFDHFFAYNFWPVLPKGEKWDPNNLPVSSVKISFDHYVTSANFDYNNDAIRNFFVNGRELVISSSDNSGGFGVQGVSLFDESLHPENTKIITHKPNVKIANAGLFALSGEGFLAASRMFNDSFDSVRFVRLDGNLKSVYFVTGNRVDLVSKPEDFRPVFVETDDGRNIFILYDSKSAKLKVFEVLPQRVNTLIEISCDSYSDNYPVDLIKLSNQYMLLFNDGLMQLLGSDFSCIRNVEDFRQSINNHKKFSLSQKFRIYSAGDKLFYSGIVWDDYQKQPEKSKLVMGYVSGDQGVTYKYFDFGVNILGHSSCQTPGGVATLVQIQQSRLTTDLIFFETPNEDFK